MKYRILILLTLFLILNTHAADAQKKNSHQVADTLKSDDSRAQKARQAYECYIGHMNQYLSCNTLEEMKEYIINNSEEIEDSGNKFVEYSDTFTEEQTEELRELYMKIEDKTQRLSNLDSTDSISNKSSAQKVEKSTVTTESDQTQEAKEAYELYIDFLEGYLKCDTMDEVNKYTADNTERVQAIAAAFSDSSPSLTPQQLAYIQQLADEVSSKLAGVAKQSSTKPEPKYSAAIRDAYLDCFQSKVENTILPSDSLFYLNSYYIERTKESCSAEVTGYSYYTIENDFDDDQRQRLQDLLLRCQSKTDSLISAKRFRISPDAVIDEMSNHFEVVKSIDLRDNLKDHDSYLQFLSMFLLDDEDAASQLNDSQKEKFLTVLFKYLNKEDEMKKNERGATKNLYAATLDELINLSQTFYNQKLKSVDSSGNTLSETDRAYFREVFNFLELLTESDFIYLFIDEARFGKVEDLFAKYNEYGYLID